jgi:threonine dehydrogenase-like Zn-dependent dehydrogenase
MRAAIQNGLSEIDVRDVSAPGRDGALVRVVATGVCGSDLHEYLQRTQPQSLPDGHEVAGEVVSLPNGYAGPIRIGDLNFRSDSSGASGTKTCSARRTRSCFARAHPPTP